MVPHRNYPAPPTGHELMALFPAAPPEQRIVASEFFRKQERDFFKTKGREIIQIPFDEPMHRHHQHPSQSSAGPSGSNSSSRKGKHRERRHREHGGREPEGSWSGAHPQRPPQAPPGLQAVPSSVHRSRHVSPTSATAPYPPPSALSSSRHSHRGSYGSPVSGSRYPPGAGPPPPSGGPQTSPGPMQQLPPHPQPHGARGTPMGGPPLAQGPPPPRAAMSVSPPHRHAREPSPDRVLERRAGLPPRLNKNSINAPPPRRISIGESKISAISIASTPTSSSNTPSPPPLRSAHHQLPPPGHQHGVQVVIGSTLPPNVLQLAPAPDWFREHEFKDMTERAMRDHVPPPEPLKEGQEPDWINDPTLDQGWRRPMPYNERRRAGKHTRRVVVQRG